MMQIIKRIKDIELKNEENLGIFAIRIGGLCTGARGYNLIKEVVKVGVLVLCLLSSMVSSVSAIQKLGVSATPSWGWIGIGGKMWTEKWGTAFNIGTSWDFNDWSMGLKGMYDLTQGNKIYIFGTIGFFIINESQDLWGSTYKYGASSYLFGAGIGKEWFRGYYKNHGIALEVGFQYGKASYEFTYDDPYLGEETWKGTYKYPPLYIGFSYTFYFYSL